MVKRLSIPTDFIMKLIVGNLVPTSLRKTKKIMIVLDESIQESTGEVKKWDFKIGIKPIPYTKTRFECPAHHLKIHEKHRSSFHLSIKNAGKNAVGLNLKTPWLKNTGRFWGRVQKEQTGSELIPDGE